MLILGEFLGGNWNTKGDKVHGSPKNSVSANGVGEEGKRESMLGANGMLMM